MKKRIEAAKTNEVIHLAPTLFRFKSLHISKPLKLVGQAGTVIEVYGGSITIDFSEEEDAFDDKKRKSHHRSGNQQFKFVKNRIAIISECEILFNRSRAWQDDKILKGEMTSDKIFKGEMTDEKKEEIDELN